MLIRPTRRALLLGAAAVPVGVLVGDSAFAPLFVAGFVAAFLIDAVAGFSAPVLTVTRRVAPNLSLNRATPVVLELHASWQRPRRVVVNDVHPDDGVAERLPVAVAVAGASTVSAAYEFTPTRRGVLAFGELIVSVASPLGLWSGITRVAQPESVRVYPDFGAIARYLALVGEQRTRRIGLHQSRRRGEGLEFHQLREYRESDSIRQIDWKATARRRMLISREYTEERDQRVLFLIDSGRRMRARDGELSHFDHALNAMLLLSYVALRQGDSVGVQVFGSSRATIPYVRGVGSINALLNGLFDVHSGLAAGDFIVAAEDAMAAQQKRALVVLVTNLREEDHDLMPALRLLRRRHVVLLVNLVETALAEIRRAPVTSFDAALLSAGAERHLQQRAEARSRHSTVAHLTVECQPAELPNQMVNSYWHLKRSGRL